MPSPTAKPDPRQLFIKAFFTTPIRNKGGINGFWAVDPQSFAEYIENVYLRSYKPQPNEPSPSVVRNNLKAARYFLRIDGLACDELFFVENGGFTGSAGTLKRLEKTPDKVAYSVIFIRRGSGGKRMSEGAVLTSIKEKSLILEFVDRKLTFFPETAAPADLAEKYGKSEVATGLAEY